MRCLSRKKSVMWRNFSTWQMSLSCVEILHMTDWHVEKNSTWEMSPKFVTWKIMCTIYSVLPHFTLFFAIYTVLLTNLFCRDLLAFWEKNLAENCTCGEKWHISGMGVLLMVLCCFNHFQFDSQSLRFQWNFQILRIFNVTKYPKEKFTGSSQVTLLLEKGTQFYIRRRRKT